ncbi:MAG: tetratricopeptide repeat protein [Desulfobacterales bacterium]
MDLINTALVNTVLCALALLGAAIMLFLVLVKSFKEGGVLPGLLGLLTGGVYTFVWGWLRSRRLHMTKSMLLWTICMIVGGALVYVTGPVHMLQSIPWAGQSGLVVSGPAKKQASRDFKNHRAPKPQKTVAEQKKAAPDPLKDADWNTRAAALWRDAQYVDVQKAVVFLENAIQEDPDFAEAYNNRGNAYREMKQYALAIQDYNKAISLNPNLAKTFNNRGNIYFDQRNFQMAIEDYSAALSLDASYALAYLNRGLAHHALNKDDMACPDLSKACDLGDCDGITWAKKNASCD